MSINQEEYGSENPSQEREIISYAASMPYLVGACSSPELAKDLACKLIDSGFPIMVQPLFGLPEGPCWLVFTDCPEEPIQETENDLKFL